MRVIFMGTPDFAVGTLEAVIAAGHEVVLAVTQPDKPKGRGKSMQAPPVKECAAAHHIPVYQPARIREAECIAYLKEFQPDIMIVAAFGQILPKDLRDAKIRLCQCTCFFASEIPRGSTNPVGSHQRRCSFGSDDHAYGRRVRYR